MSKKRLLIIEDESSIVQLLRFALEAQYEIHAVDTLRAAEAALRAEIPHIIILDWMLPDGNGVQLLAMLRRDARYRHLPILMLTARSSEADITKGLETGANDYLTKPFSVAELQARLKALLRRSGEEERSQELHYPPLRMDLSSNQVFYQQTPIPLHRREFALLRCLMKHSGKVLSREQLLDQAWGDDGEIADRAVDVSVRQLRKAFEDQG